MTRLEPGAQGNGCRFVLQPNRSASWQHTKLLYSAAALLALLIGIFFVHFGAWPVAPFAGLEMLALGAGLYVASRNAYRCEWIAIDRAEVTVWQGVGSPRLRWRAPQAWTAIYVDDALAGGDGPGRLRLGFRGRLVEVGAFLHAQERHELARELARALRQERRCDARDPQL